MGFGFGYDSELSGVLRTEGQHSFIRGNHDKPSTCHKAPGYLGEYGMRNDIFFIGGGFSIDRNVRTMGIDMWEDEELSQMELISAIGICELKKPVVVCSHVAPVSVFTKVLEPFYIAGNKNPITSRTELALDAMFQEHKPKLWVCGHYHISKQLEVEGTKFVFLNELETFKY